MLDKLVEEHYHELNENDLYIWQYILHHKPLVAQMTIHDLAKECNVSHTSIIRFTKKIDLDGFSELKVRLKLEMKNKISLPDNMFEKAIDSYNYTIDYFMNNEFDDILEHIYQSKRVFVYGSGHLQTHVALELKRSFLYGDKVFHVVGSGTEIDNCLANTTKDDMFMIVSLSGDNEVCVELAKALKTMKIYTIAIAGKGDNLLRKYCDEIINIDYSRFSIGGNRLTYSATSQMFLTVDLLFLKYLEYLEDTKNIRSF